MSTILQREIDSLTGSAEMGVKSENGVAGDSDAVLDKNLYSRQMYVKLLVQRSLREHKSFGG